MKIEAGEVKLFVPLNWDFSRGVITVHLPVTTPPGTELHMNTFVFRSKVQNSLEKPATVLVSRLSEAVLPCREDRSQGASLPQEMRKGRLVRKKGNKPMFALRTELFRITGTDLTQVDGIDVVTAATILSEADGI